MKWHYVKTRPISLGNCHDLLLSFILKPECHDPIKHYADPYFFYIRNRKILNRKNMDKNKIKVGSAVQKQLKICKKEKEKVENS